MNKKSNTAVVETGNRVGRIVDTLARQGYMAPFGDSPSVGIGGITPGGGIGPLQRTTGLISDNLLALEMVDAKGRVIRASKKRNADLLWASQGGGGGNFGVYTKYKFKVRRAPVRATVFSITWPWEQFEEVVKAWQRWAPFTSTKLGSELSVGPKKGGNVSMLGVYLGCKKKALKFLQPILSVGTTTKKDIRSLPWPQATKFLLAPDPILPQKFSNQFSSGFGRRPFPDKAFKYMREFLEKAEGGTPAGFYFLNWGGAIRKIAPRATAFYWRDPQYYVEWNSSWVKPSHAAKNIALARNTRKKLQPFIVGSYINVPDQGIKCSGPVYYGKNYARLRRVKAKYDPQNVFNNPQSIPPAK
ncbi:hypothetical protein FHT67_003536 [Paenibacillus sp. BK720]|nr:hypothetical protein [Paenibacillus sp. BK720]